MWEIKPGDLVVCVDDNARTFIPPSGQEGRFTGNLRGLKKGEIYTVSNIGAYEELGYQTELTLYIEEIVRPNPITGRDVGFLPSRFRPVSKTRTEEFRKLVAPAPSALVEA